MEQFVIHSGRFTGQRALLLSWSAWLICLIAMPVTPVFLGNFHSVALLVCSNVALWIGLSASTLWEGYSDVDKSRQQAHGTSDINTIMVLLIIAGCIAMVARAADYGIFRGINFSDTYDQVRQKLQNSGPNVLSAVYGLGFPAAVASGVLAIPLLRAGGRRAIASLAIIPFAATPIFSFLVGGRSTLFMIVGLTLITLLLVTPQFSTRIVVILTSTLLATFIATMILFTARVAATGIEFREFAQFSGYTQLVPLDDGVLIAMRNLSPFPKLVIFYITSVGQYILHGVFEFFSLISLKSPDDPFLLGRYEFLIIDPIRKILFPGIPITDLEIYNPTSGMFTTFWGPAYLDFGYFMVPFGFAFGYIVSLTRRLVDRGELFALPLYVLFLLQILLVPIGNALQMAGSITLNLGFLGIWAFSRFLGARHASRQELKLSLTNGHRSSFSSDER